jgi:hypothetical protein
MGWAGIEVESGEQRLVIDPLVGFGDLAWSGARPADARPFAKEHRPAVRGHLRAAGRSYHALIRSW